jgi:hypothetical protein
VRNRLILCVGFRGSGKSTVASNILRVNSSVFVFDPHLDDAYRWIPNTARTMEQLGDYQALVFFPDRSFWAIRSRDAGLGEVVLQESASVREDQEEETA